jgi:hypothetical protein
MEENSGDAGWTTNWGVVPILVSVEDLVEVTDGDTQVMELGGLQTADRVGQAVCVANEVPHRSVENDGR